MSYAFFQDVLEALGKKVNFESISNMYGKTVFGKKDGQAITKMIQEANPFTKPSTTNSASAILGMGGNITIIETDDQKKSAEKTLGDMSWFEEYLK